jgi:malonyl-CoA O-methyltransferase
MEPDDAYRQWAATYAAAPHNALMAAEQRAVVSLLPGRAGRSLDAGCGTGRYLRVLAERLSGWRLGIDRSAAMLARADRAAPLAQADIRAVPLPDASIDLVVCGLTLMDLPHPAAALAEWARILVPAGIAIYSVLHPRGEALGWVRTFATEAGLRSIRACWLPVVDHLQALREAGFVVEGVLEPGLDGPGQPVALVIRARRAP